MHVATKESSTTTKVRASAKTSTGVSLNETLLVGPTVHSSLVNVLLCFWFHRVAFIADMSSIYLAIALAEDDKDLHRFVWRNSPEDTLKDYRMTRVRYFLCICFLVHGQHVRHTECFGFHFGVPSGPQGHLWMTASPELTPVRRVLSCTSSYRVYSRKVDSCSRNGVQVKL